MKRRKEPHGSTWFYTAAPDMTPAEAAEMLRRLEAIPAYQPDRAPRKPETIEAYAARMAARLGLPAVGARGEPTRQEFLRNGRYVGEDRPEWERLPDDEDSNEKKEAA